MKEYKKIVMYNFILIILVSVLTCVLVCTLILNTRASPSINTATNTITLAQPKERLIDLNTASLDELKSLPNIGRELARKIIQNRPYSSVWDLSKIKGIGINIIRCIEKEVECNE